MTIDEARGHLERRELSVVRAPADGELDPEYGEITNVNDRYVFVRYRGRCGSAATNPAELTSCPWPDERTERRRQFRAGLRAPQG